MSEKLSILVVGRGWTGYKMFHELNKRNHIVSLVSHKALMDDSIFDNKYDWIVNCAGVTGTPNVDACEKDKFGTIKGNTLFPIVLQRLSDDIGCKLAHFSSGCIYSGDITDILQDANFFGSTYSISKGLSDGYLKHMRDVLILRIRMPFTGVYEQKNYLTKVMKYAKNGKLIDSGQNSMTDLDEAVKITADLIERNITGVYNLVNPGSVSMHELAELLEVEPKWFTPDEFAKATAAGRSNCTIPAAGIPNGAAQESNMMRPLKIALKEAIAKMRTPSIDSLKNQHLSSEGMK